MFGKMARIVWSACILCDICPDMGSKRNERRALAVPLRIAYGRICDANRGGSVINPYGISVGMYIGAECLSKCEQV